MNRSQIDEAMKSGRPFTIRTADGREFLVPTRDHILISPRGTFVQVIDDDERINSIPLLTMTSVEYRPSPG
jgi:hypothetical protein